MSNSERRSLIIHSVPRFRSPRLWGTFSASGGAGATTLAIHLARISSRLGHRTLVVESDERAPLREILGGLPPFWEEYRGASTPIKPQALPQNLETGFALLTRRSILKINETQFLAVCEAAATNYDLVIFDNPPFENPQLKNLIVVQNTLPSLIGLNALNLKLKPKIVIVNKSSNKIKNYPAISGFITDTKIFTLRKSQDLNLTLGLPIVRKLSSENEKIMTGIVEEILG